MTPQEIGAKANALRREGLLEKEQVIRLSEQTKTPGVDLQALSKQLDRIGRIDEQGRGVWIRPYIPRSQ